MGTSDSKHAQPLPAALSIAERADLEHRFRILVKQENSTTPTITTSSFSTSTFPTLPPNVIKAVAVYCTLKSASTPKASASHATHSTISFAGFATAVHVLTAGSPFERSEFVTVYEKSVEKADTRQFLKDLAHGLQFYRPATAKPSPDPQYTPSDRFVDYLLFTISSSHSTTDVFANSSSPPTSQQPPPLSAFSSFFATSPHLHTLFTLLFTGTFFPSNPLPGSHPSLSPPASALLSREDIFLLNESIPSETRLGAWKGLFSSDRDGGSWTVFTNRVEEAGATVLVVRDKRGNVFGGFAGSEWAVRPKFYGDASSFLFSLQPTMQIYRASGINANYQYFNHGMHTLPNGIGFGGQLDYFGLWIDSSFERGHSRGDPRSTTYDNPRLSGSAEFEVDFVEAWLIKPKEVDDRLVDDRKKGSILGNTEAEALLEMGGKTMVSKGYREPVREEEG